MPERWRSLSAACVASVAVCAALLGPGVGLARAEPPEPTAKPAVVSYTGQEITHANKGEKLECTSGSWRGVVSTFYYTWLREGVEIAGATRVAGEREGYLYVVKAADEGSKLSCDVIAVSGHEEEEELSQNEVLISGKAPAKAPANAKAPRVSGSAKVGATLTCESGEWTGSPSYSYEWFRATSSSKEVASAYSSPATYVVKEADEGHSLSCEVKATNGNGSAEAASENSVAIPSQKKPENKERPKVLGGSSETTAKVGQTLSCSPGTWTAEPTFAYRWLRSGTKIEGAEGSTYPVQKADQLKSLSCEVTATNQAGSEKATSSNSVEVVGEAPVDETEPEITGKPEVGATLTCEPGRWGGVPAPEFKYTWLVNSVSSGEAQKFKVVEADSGKRITCQVKAKNTYGSEVAESAPVVVPEKVPVGAKPEPKSKPEIRGGNAVGETLECLAGTWSGTPAPTFTYEWTRTGGAGEEVVSGWSSADTYQIKGEDRGGTLWCSVTGTNSEGSATAKSTTGKAIPGEGPELVQRPTISGKPLVGETLTCNHGTWKASPTPTFAYRWTRNGAEVTTGSSSYVVHEIDRGTNLACVVTASNSAGSTEASSESMRVPGVAPEDNTRPTIEGTPKLGDVLACQPGTWSGVPAPKFSYQWLRDGKSIESATNAGYTVNKIDVGHALSCKVTARNEEDESVEHVAYSAPVSVAGTAPELVEEPEVLGNTSVGDTIKCTPGVWNAKPPPTFSYQWLLGGEPIEGATEPTYVVAEADLQHWLSCEVTAENTEGESSATSESVEAVQAAIKILPPAKTLIGVSGETTEKAPPVTAAEILAKLRTELTKAENAAHIKKLRKTHNYSFSFTALGAGQLEYFWYETPKAAAHSKKKPKPVLIAHVTSSFSSAGKTETVVLHFTNAGLRVIKSSRHLKLMARAAFARPKLAAVSWSGTFVLAP